MLIMFILNLNANIITKKVNLLREDIYKGRFHRRKSKEDDEQLQVILQEKKQMYKKKSFKGALFTIMIATLILTTYNIFISQHENVLHVISWYANILQKLNSRKL